ncbi:unnamed protein product [Heterotrigona itama]|uniref:Arrestin-like N-terminal domain-containing protein n=1 Tax=Heterotrigona itama TaxID=395501 RepID=A0A6V7H9I5_9HYME|nr:unnamed protein product [Heterotrigona itama]
MVFTNLFLSASVSLCDQYWLPTDRHRPQSPSKDLLHQISRDVRFDLQQPTSALAYPLPENLPCSFEGRYGRVRYSIRALLDVTTIYRFSTNIIPFTVAPILDLNRDPLASRE